MKAPRYTKLRGNVFWFQIGIPAGLRHHYRKGSIQESLRTSDRAVAAHMAAERAVYWKREFRLLQGTSVDSRSPREVYLATVRQVEWIQENYRDADDRDLQLDLLWNGVAEPEARRLGLIDISEASPDQVNREVDAALKAIRNAQRGSKTTPAEFRAPFSEIAAAFIADRQRDARSRLTDQTVSQSEAVFRLFRDHTSDAPLTLADAKTAASFFDKVKRLGRNWGRSPETKKRPLDELLALSADSKDERLSTRTLNRYVSSLSGLWDWAQKRGEVAGSNPFASHWTESKTRKGANAPWTETTLRVLLAGYADAGSKGSPDPIYWLPRIALLSGMRLNEICSIEIRDIKEAEGVRYFDVPKGKTESSVRVVPVHDALAPLVDDLAPERGHLFPLLKPATIDGKRGAQIGKVLGRRFKRIEGGSTFHGFRKNVAEAFERARVPETEAAQILGHKKTGMTYGVYSPRGLTIAQKRDLIHLLSLPSL